MTAFVLQQRHQREWEDKQARSQEDASPLGDGVLGELAREEQADRGLDLARRKRALLVVPVARGQRKLTRALCLERACKAWALPCQANSFSGHAVKRVVNEAVHDGHGLLGDASL